MEGEKAGKNKMILRMLPSPSTVWLQRVARKKEARW